VNEDPFWFRIEKEVECGEIGVLGWSQLKKSRATLVDDVYGSWAHGVSDETCEVHV
jgi:hypothetical protein